MDVGNKGVISHKQGNDHRPSDVYVCILNICFGSSDLKKVPDSLIAPFFLFFVWEMGVVVLAECETSVADPQRKLGPTVPQTPPFWDWPQMDSPATGLCPGLRWRLALSPYAA